MPFFPVGHRTNVSENLDRLFNVHVPSEIKVEGFHILDFSSSLASRVLLFQAGACLHDKGISLLLQVL